MEMPLESSLIVSPARREFLQKSITPFLLAVAAGGCNTGPAYNYNEGFLGDQRFNTGGELEYLVNSSHEANIASRANIDQLVLASRKAFMNVPVGEWKGKLPPGKITVLYPAAGVHIMPLQLGYRIMRQDSGISEVEFIYTEVDSNSEIGFKRQLAMLEKVGLVRNINAKIKFYPDNNVNYKSSADVPHETTYSFEVLEPNGRHHRIIVIYALNRSGTDLFRKEYAQRADIVISHDSDTWNIGKDFASAAFKVDGSDRYQSQRNLILLTEPDFVIGLSPTWFSNAFNTVRDRDFPNRIQAVKGRYGCEGESPFMLMMYLDKNFVNSEHGQRSLRKYFE